MASYSNILSRAKKAVSEATTWADASNALFDPLHGIFAGAFRSVEERRAFIKSDEYRKIREMLDEVTVRTGLVSGATPKKSGKFLVRVPRSMHVALDREAKSEGVSLNQLVMAKLAIQLETLSGGQDAIIIRSFAEVREGFSSDRVVVDPILNARFLNKCRELGAKGTDFDLNWMLLGARKKKWLTNFPKTTKTTFRETDVFDFASEIAVRCVQEDYAKSHPDVPSLDRILCDPALRATFDSIAQLLAPGFTSLEYRWVALGLRKARRLIKNAGAIELPQLERCGAVRSISKNRIPDTKGVYVLRCDQQALFVGETDNLRQRIERHLEFNGGKVVPDWIYDCGSKAIHLSLSALPDVTHTDRRTIEFGIITNEHPIFNYVHRSSKAA